MQSWEDRPHSSLLASGSRGRRSNRISKPSVSAFFAGAEELEDTGHSAALLAQLKNFYDTRMLCDVTIEVVTPGSEPSTRRLFSCNRNVLAAASPYFKTMFTSGMYESQQSRVTIRDVDIESFDVLVNYCYTGRLSLTEAKVQHLYVASDMFQLLYVREACASFMARRLDLTNCIAILKFADAFHDHMLHSQTQAFIASNFKQLSRMGSNLEETLADLTPVQLAPILSLDSLNVESEKTVCDVALQWLEAAPEERGPSAAAVFKYIRWALFRAEDQDYLEGLLTKPMVKKYCLDIIAGALLQLHFGHPPYKAVAPKPDSSNSCSSSSSVVSVAENPPRRLGMCAKEMVIFFGHPRDPFLCYDPYSEDIYTMPSPLTHLAHARNITPSAVCVSPDHDIYLAAQFRKDLWVYKPVLNCWHQLENRLLCREGMDIAYLDGYVYILGGRNPITGAKLREMECYSVQRNQWTLVAPVPHSFYSFELIVVQHCLYAVNSKRMVCYDPSHNRWLNCASLKQNDFKDACVFKDEIYCICDTPVVKVYNPARGKWRQISNIPLDSEIHNYQIVSYSQKLLLITATTPQWKKNRVIVYEYDTRENQWINIGTMLDLVKFFSGFICLSTRVYPSYLEPGQDVIIGEDDATSDSSTEWAFYDFSDSDSESGTSSSLSEDEVWVQVAPRQNTPVTK
ncbi:kelch repeat and BTB domain-containing protein 7-like [Microtus ochrogaster]|uniref:Kelch repeat and BTB domain-containing protein 7-like n=1 Tax=Microtus ochrogaster TaxID=79684 RepID=A0ABM0LLJ0_MICOH|nr:kelch repeat and BTB domain-containing protein 7-like [Microtus ochrogaster]